LHVFPFKYSLIGHEEERFTKNPSVIKEIGELVGIKPAGK
jgi:hypothetical protein